VDEPGTRPNVVVVMPASNAGRTLKMTYEELPKDTRIAEISVPTRYLPEASAASLPASVVYGLRILAVLFWYTRHACGVRRSRRFDSLRARYRKVE